MIGVDNDGSDLILEAFCQSCMTGKRVDALVDEAYCATTLCLLGNMAMEKGAKVTFPDEYKIPYMILQYMAHLHNYQLNLLNQDQFPHP